MTKLMFNTYKPIMLIKSKELPKRVLCIGLMTKDQTMIVHKEGAKK